MRSLKKHREIIGLIISIPGVLLVLLGKSLDILIIGFLCLLISLYCINGLAFLIILIVCAGISTLGIWKFLEFINKDRSIYKYFVYILENAAVFIFGVIILYGSYLIVRKLVKEKDNKSNNAFIVMEMFIFIGLLLVVPSLLSLIGQIALFFKKLGLKDGLTGASVVVAIVTCLIGAGVKLKINKDNEKKDRMISMHKEMNWRNGLHKLEIQDGYTIGDLVKLNSYFNPESDSNVDKEINYTIVRILKDHNIDMFEEKKDRQTLFDFKLTKSAFDYPLNLKENRDIRKNIHKLLKNDWDIQTKK